MSEKKLLPQWDENLEQACDEVDLEDDCEDDDEKCDEDFDENLEQPSDEVDLSWKPIALLSFSPLSLAETNNTNPEVFISLLKKHFRQGELFSFFYPSSLNLPGNSLWILLLQSF